ncbi:MAG: ATP-binding protein [Flavobacteriia bacterium]|nr:ATP-binding protein [Flavobacteriia bacterium]
MENTTLFRALIEEAKQVADEFKIVCVTGPRQAGKTTLCKLAFPEKSYVSLEDPDVLIKVIENPRAFLNQYKKGAILDEVQNVPILFNYLQGIVDNKSENNQFVLSGSNNFLMQTSISQSLAGRVGYIELLPFTLQEIKDNNLNRSLLQHILEGFYPAIVTKKSSYKRWTENYIKTYIERDVRQIRNIGNILVFHKFLKICAGRAGQLLNVSSISKDIGVDVKTIEAWLGVLESSYIVFRLAPLHPNFNKRVIKSPKLYFYDTGVLCSLLGIKSIESLEKSNNYGAIFENFILAEVTKNRKNKQQDGNLYFFRDSIGNEVDLVIEKEVSYLPVEIKATSKFNKEQLRNLKWFQKVFRQDGGLLVNAGTENLSFEKVMNLVGWEEVKEL